MKLDMKGLLPSRLEAKTILVGFAEGAIMLYLGFVYPKKSIFDGIFYWERDYSHVDVEAREEKSGLVDKTEGQK